jgi:anti-sigma regulatory factor (Ser/Thr protein kinase)
MVARRFPSDTASIRKARSFVRGHVDEASPGWERLDDLQLVTSELTTNAVEYGSDGWIDVALDIDDAAITLTVTSAGTDKLADPAMWVGPAAVGPSGRGLMIVRSLVDDVTVTDGDGRLAIRCVLSRS